MIKICPASTPHITYILLRGGKRFFEELISYSTDVSGFTRITEPATLMIIDFRTNNIYAVKCISEPMCSKLF